MECEDRLTVANYPSSKNVTKRKLVSDVAKVFDVLGWFAPATVRMKILLQRLWEQNIDWDDPVPAGIGELWARWMKELPTLASKSIPRCHFPREAKVTSMQVHGFSDASEDAYASVVYVRLASLSGSIYTSLVMQGVAHQENLDPTAGTLWSSFACATSPTRQGCIPFADDQHLCLD